MMRVWLYLIVAMGWSGCAAEAMLEEPDVHGEEDLGEPDLAVTGEALSLSGLGRGCSTAGTERLSAQLLDEMACLSEGALVRVEHPNIILTSSRVHPYLSPQGRDALLRAAASRRIEINSALRTIAEQYVLQRGCSVAAAPGRSNHETGRAIDVANYGTVGSTLVREGFSHPLPSSDPVHYEAPGRDLRSISVLAFQKLWNVNNPGDRIAEDGVAGSGTLSRLGRAPTEGFAIPRACRAAPPPPPVDPDPPPAVEDPPAGGGSCTHTAGGTYADRGCSASYQCCSGTWRSRTSGCGGCTCVESTGRTGCVPAGAPPPPPPAAPTGDSCSHSFGGAYAHTACSASYQCCDGAWRSRTAGCGTCFCTETTGETGCGM